MAKYGPCKKIIQREAHTHVICHLDHTAETLLPGSGCAPLFLTDTKTETHSMERLLTLQMEQVGGLTVSLIPESYQAVGP